VGIKRVVLEHHRYVSILGWNIIDELTIDVYFAFSDIFESCDHSERRCLPTARRTYEDHELLVIDGDVGIRDCSHIAFVHLSNTF